MKHIILLLFIFPFTIYSQSKLDFEFDFAQFGYDSSNNFVEFYYSFNQTGMKLVEDSDGKRIDGILKIHVEDSLTGEVLINNQWKVSHPVLEEGADYSQSLIGIISFILPEGSLKCEIIGSDLNNPSNSKIITDYIRVKPIFKDDIGISDIQLAYKMVQGSENKNSIFYKNTYEVIPIPNLVFGKEQPVLFFYVELYNLENLSAEESKLKLIQLIVNSRGKIVNTKDKYFSRTTDSRVEVGSFVIANLPTDTYTLVVQLIDSIQTKGVTTSKKFFVYNPDLFVDDTSDTGNLSLLATTFGSMSDEELDDIFDKSKYIATSAEIDQYKKLGNEEGKKQFMNDFWKARDLISDSRTNEYYLNYFQRVEIANSRYATLAKPGWKSDRGRIFLIYGEPSEIERYPSQIETRPYEIWHYNEIEGGVIFVFADLLGFSDYSLVHSTKRGELRDDNWVRRIYVR